MFLLVIGLVIFLGIHSIRILAPAFRTGFIDSRGDGAWKGLYSVISIIGFVVMVYGYGIAREDADLLYSPVSGALGIALIVVPIALVLVMASQFPAGYIKRTVGHPMLWGIILWALAHLANNGDTASVLLFGALLVWAVADLVSCYRRGGRPPEPKVLWDGASVIIGLVLTYAFVKFLHEYLFGVGIV